MTNKNHLQIDPRELSSNAINDPIADSYSLQIDATYTEYLKWLLIERFSDGDSVCLDGGVSNGNFAIPLSYRVQDVHGIDISEKMLSVCEENVRKSGQKNVHLHLRSVTNTGFEDNFFDLAFSYSTLLLVPEPHRAYSEFHRVLKPGGIAVMDITGKYNLSQRFWASYYQKKGHFGLNAYALPEIKEELEEIGFEILESHALGFLDQWKYIPGVHWLKFLERIFHGTSIEPDLDYKVSNRFPGLANRWYFVLRKN